MVIDTNVLIAALRSRRGASYELLRQVGDPRWRLHCSTALLLEYEEVARRQTAELWAEPERVEEVLDYLAANAEEHAISFRWRPLLADPDDDFLMELAMNAGARYIVTHNVKDFAGVERFGIEVVTPAQMLQKLRTT